MANLFAYLIFFGWPLVVFWMLFKYPAKKAVFLAITIAVLLLPSGLVIDPPLIPPLDRESITAMSLIIFLVLLGKKFRVFQSGPATKVLIGYFIVVVISAELNDFPVRSGNVYLPAVTHYDAFSSVLRMFLWMIPFFLGRYFLSNFKDNEAIFKLLVGLGLIYSLPMLFELKMSPQLHNVFYGYHASDFIQQMRSGGFRPTVFVGHGLSLAFWFSTCVIAAYALHKNNVRYSKFSSAKILLYLMVVLLLCKTWSAFAYVLIGIYFMAKLTHEKQIKWSFIISATVLLYPITKILGLFPDEAIIDFIRGFSPERAESLAFRFRNETVLLNRALEQPYFGWAGWGRNRLFDEYGRDAVVTDGKWIIEFGINGGFGFLFYYIIFLTPIFYAMKTLRYIEEAKERTYFSVLAIILAICIIDSVPNTGMGSMHLFLAGALLGQAELLKKLKYSALNKNDNKLNE